MSGAKICLVTVTYGRRLAYVIQALESALKEGVHHAVVIDNGSVVPVEEVLRKRFGDWVGVERFDSNRGSAPGFKRGMQLAYKSGCDLIVLLDDDNQLTSGCLKTLMLERKALADRYSDNNCMVLAYRPGHQPAEAIGETNGFLGFDVKDIPRKIGKRIGLGKWVRTYRSSAKLFQLPYAPYSGMLFHRSVVENHGLPDERFVLYADDSEYSYRLTASGGCVAVVPHAHLAECERSWNVATDKKGFINKLASSTIDFRIYYAIRNRCYFEQFCLKARGPAREFNKRMFLLLLRLACAVHSNKQNWQILRQAIDDGENQRLGRSHLAAVQFS